MPASVWLSHHVGAESCAVRCVRWKDLTVCRRCLALWPFVFAAIAAQIALGVEGTGARDGLAALLLAPAVIEYIWVHAFDKPYDAARVWALSPAAGLAIGRLLYRHMIHPFDPLAWAILGAAALSTGWALLRYHAKSNQ
jgi:hypothetical protein